MELEIDRSPCDSAEALALWSRVFGPDEAALEAPQLDGTEAGENADLLYVLREGKAVAGTLHATIPLGAPALCGLSGMCVDPAYRGRGLARRLLGAMLETLDASGVEAAFLGTDNPVAAGLYAGFGFAFLPGSNVMARFARGGALAFERRAFDVPAGAWSLRVGSPGLRIPLIPLALHRGSQFLLDRNAGILSTAAVTQRSCMGLYPRYDALTRAGGGCFGAWSERGMLIALASVQPTEEGPRADFFCCDHGMAAAQALLALCRERFGALYFQLAVGDAGKRACVERLGYRPGATEQVSFGRLSTPCVRYAR